jgi:SNF family Na+-dependent transporter
MKYTHNLETLDDVVTPSTGSPAGCGCACLVLFLIFGFGVGVALFILEGLLGELLKGGKP